VFARLADGSAKAVREIAGQKTLMGRANHGIAYDAIHDEFTTPNTLGQAILTFRGGANGEESPIRVIQGPLTQLRNPDQLTSDPVHNEILVSESYAILVFAREANGDVAPIRVLKVPPDTRYAYKSVAVDPVHNLLVITGHKGRESDKQSRLFIFNRTDEGYATPKAMVGGPKSRLRPPGAHVYVYPPKGEIVIGSGGFDSDRLPESEADGFVGVWSIQDNGDVPPKWTIGGPKGSVWKPRGIAFDPKHKSIMVTDMGLNSVMTFYFPEMF
jgi:hypothetical protein